MVERDGLENRCGRKPTEGSNPSLSAMAAHFQISKVNAAGSGVDSAGDPTGLLPVIFFTGDFLQVIFLPVIFFAGVGLFGAFLIVTHRNLPTLSALHSLQAVPRSP